MVPKASRPAPITYYALDLEERELQRTLSEITMSDVGKTLEGKVDTKGLWGTYDDGLKFVEAGGLQPHNVATRISVVSAAPYKVAATGDVSPISSTSSRSNTTASDMTPPSTPDAAQPPLHILFLGSSLGNFCRSEGADFLRSLPLRPGSGDTLLIGMDHDNDKALIEEAYNDRKGYTKRFIMNGLRAAGKALGNENMFDENQWDYVNNYNVTERMSHPPSINSLLQASLSRQTSSVL
jgi:hypothetical protein